MRHTISRFAAVGLTMTVLGCAPKPNFGILAPSTDIVKNHSNQFIFYNNGSTPAANPEVWQASPATDVAVFNFTDPTNPQNGQYCMSLTISSYGSTNGGWSGFAFLPLTPPENFSTENFSTCTFWARATVPSVSAYSFIIMNAPAQTEALTTTWTEMSLPVPAPSTLTALTGPIFYVGVSGTPPYTVYIDDVTFQ